MLRSLAATLVVSAVALAPASAYASPLETPSIVQLCAATSVDEVDTLLAGVAATDLVGDLAPLATLVVPADADALVVKGDVDLDQVREQLGCATATPVPDPDPTDDPAPDPTTDPTPSDDPTATPVPDGQDDGADTGDSPSTGGEGDDVDPTSDDGSQATTSGEQVIEVPQGSVDTGGR